VDGPPVPASVRGLARRATPDMRKGFDRMALIVQETLKRDPHSDHLFVFRGRRRSHKVLMARRPGPVTFHEEAELWRKLGDGVRKAA
jgi:transposase